MKIWNNHLKNIFLYISGYIISDVYSKRDNLFKENKNPPPG
jgi:hypothetical protein